MATYHLGPGPGGIPTNALSDVNIEYHDEAGTLVDVIFRPALVTWSYFNPNPFPGVGDSLTSDELIGTLTNDLIFWDWETVSDNATTATAAQRYFLPAANQIAAIDIFRLGEGNDILNLTYDRSVAGFQSYDFHVTAYGGTGNDLLMSGGGNDFLYGEEGADTIFGGGGNDFIDVRSNAAEPISETAYGGSGNDIIHGGEGNDLLFGGEDDDTIEGYGGLDTISGDGGNDLIFGGGGATTPGDALNGGAGNDTVYGGDGADVITGGTGFLDRLFGGDGDDQLADEDGVVLMVGGAGNDMMYSNFVVGWSAPGSLATIYGGGGADSFSMGSVNPNLNLVIAMDDGSADAADSVILSNVANQYATVTATLGGGADIYHGSRGGAGTRIDRVDGGAGNDTLYGGAGSDTLYGGAGFLDVLMGGAQTALGADAGDALFDPDGVAYARGGEGDDTLTISFAFNWTGPGGGAADLVTLDGNGGNDQFGLGSANALQRLVINADDGSADGNDIVNWAAGSSYAAVTATMGGGNDVYIGAGAGGTGARSETVYGGTGSDTIDGGAGFLDVLYGDDPGASLADGADLITDADGVAYARGGQGNDTFNITFAADWIGPLGGASDVVTLDGGGGADHFQLYSNNAAQRLVINGDDGSTDAGDTVDWAGAASSYDRVTATLGAGNDTYVGTGPGGGSGNRIDIVYGGVGSDTLSGGAGDDTLYGSNAGNSLFDGDDTLFGRAGNDTLAGGYGIDTLDGGAGDDVLVFNPDNTVTGDSTAQDYVQAWDGDTRTAQHSYNGLTVNWSFDVFIGGADIDSLVGTAGNDILLANTDDLYVNGSAQPSGPGRLAGIEVVLLGAGADIFMANDPTGSAASGIAYATALTVYGGDGSDVIYTGAGHDRLVGDQFAAGVGADMLAGGLGNDLIWGDLEGLPDAAAGGRDTLYGGGGNDTLFGGGNIDTLYGGSGADTLYGGAGDDFVFDDNHAALFFGGDGSDYFLLGYRDPTQATGASSTGGNDGGDGDDRVFVWVADGQLQYDSISVSMGDGNDLFISADVVGGNGIDRIAGEMGDDVISSWGGNDTIDGGRGDDALWGGAGGDTIFGGPGTDYIYPGPGDNDVAYGGAGIDYYYWARTDGANDQIFDEYRGTPGTDQQALNALIVFPGYDANGVMPTGTGVVETDRNLHDNAGGDDMVRVVDIDGDAGTLWRLEILAGAGAGSSIVFDQRDIQTIALWNHEPVGGQQVYQVYEWDPNAQSGGAYVYVSG